MASVAGGMTRCALMLSGDGAEQQCQRRAGYGPGFAYCKSCTRVWWPSHPTDYDLPKEPRIAKPKKRQRPEDDLQMQCCDLLSKLPATLFWSTPNHLYLGSGEAYKKAYYINKQKMMGMNPGATDLNVLFRNRGGASTLLLCELKIKPNKPSTEQNTFMDSANGLGAFTGVAYTFEEFLSMLKVAGHPSLINNHQQP